MPIVLIILGGLGLFAGGFITGAAALALGGHVLIRRLLGG